MKCPKCGSELLQDVNIGPRGGVIPMGWFCLNGCKLATGSPGARTHTRTRVYGGRKK